MPADNCLFCRIVAGEIPAEVIYENELVVGFRDINPKAPTHVLVIPRKHISTINDIADDDAKLLGAMYLGARDIAAQEALAAPGYRTVMNCGEAAGQSVFHIHLHVMGGRTMTWPPG